MEQKTFFDNLVPTRPTNGEHYFNVISMYTNEKLGVLWDVDTLRDFMQDFNMLSSEDRKKFYLLSIGALKVAVIQNYFISSAVKNDVIVEDVSIGEEWTATGCEDNCLNSFMVSDYTIHKNMCATPDAMYWMRDDMYIPLGVCGVTVKKTDSLALKTLNKMRHRLAFKEWYRYQIKHIEAEKDMRLADWKLEKSDFNSFVEICPHCGEEAHLIGNEVQPCQHCGKLVKPCSICDMDKQNYCSECPFN